MMLLYTLPPSAMLPMVSSATDAAMQIVVDAARAAIRIVLDAARAARHVASRFMPTTPGADKASAPIPTTVVIVTLPVAFDAAVSFSLAAVPVVVSYAANPLATAIEIEIPTATNPTASRSTAHEREACAAAVDDHEVAPIALVPAPVLDVTVDLSDARVIAAEEEAVASAATKTPTTSTTSACASTAVRETETAEQLPTPVAVATAPSSAETPNTSRTTAQPAEVPVAPELELTAAQPTVSRPVSPLAAMRARHEELKRLAKLDQVEKRPFTITHPYFKSIYTAELDKRREMMDKMTKIHVDVDTIFMFLSDLQALIEAKNRGVFCLGYPRAIVDVVLGALAYHNGNVDDAYDDLMHKWMPQYMASLTAPARHVLKLRRALLTAYDK